MYVFISIYLCNITSPRRKGLKEVLSGKNWERKSPFRASFFLAYYLEVTATDAGYKLRLHAIFVENCCPECLLRITF